MRRALEEGGDLNEWLNENQVMNQVMNQGALHEKGEHLPHGTDGSAAGGLLHGDSEVAAAAAVGSRLKLRAASFCLDMAPPHLDDLGFTQVRSCMHAHVYV